MICESNHGYVDVRHMSHKSMNFRVALEVAATLKEQVCVLMIWEQPKACSSSWNQAEYR